MTRKSLAGAAITAAMLTLPATAQAAPPIFGVTSQTVSAFLGQHASFGATAVDHDGDAVTVTWTFDDSATATGEFVNHVWATVGTHTATVTATDTNGEFAQHTFTFTVLPIPSGGGGSLTPLPPAPSTPDVGLVDDVLKLSRSGSIPVRLRCAPFVDCHGAMTIAARGRKLGSVTFAVPLAQTRTVKVKLSKPVRKRLKRRKVRVAVTVTLADQAPVTVVTTLKTR